VPRIRRPVIGLRLAAQHRLHHQRLFRLVRNVLEHPVEQAGRHHLPERQLLSHRGEVIAQGNQLLAARRLVDAVDHRRGLGLERLGRRDIGGDHEILNHAVRIEPFADGDFGNPALFVEHHAAFWQFQFERIAGLPCIGECFPRRPQVGEIFGRVAAIDCGLRILVGNVVRDPHQRAGEAETAHLPIGIDVQVAGHCRAVFALFQRANVGRKHFGHHRHHAVGEVNRVAALPGLAIQRGAGADVE